MNSLIDGYSLEVGTKSVAALAAEAARIPPASTIFIPYLSGESDEARLQAARAVRELGFEPMPHIAVRQVRSQAEANAFIERAVGEAGVERFFIVAGDLAVPKGPFADSLSLIETGVFERLGVKILGIGGHPEGHSTMSMTDRWHVLERKCQAIAARGMAPVIVTQFAFDAGIILAWLTELRERGIGHEVRVGVPGPAGIAVLARYAALCGVGASASVLARYGISLGKLLGTAGPDQFVEQLASGLTNDHGPVHLHFFPFGGVEKTVRWIGGTMAY